MSSLLEKALGTTKRVQLKSPPITEEDVELALAWICGKISTSQAARAYGKGNDRLTPALYRIANCLRVAYEYGYIKIKQ